MRTAIIHYWAVDRSGGERVLETLCDLFPDADVYTHTYAEGALSPGIASRGVRTTFIHRLPNAPRWRHAYLPLMPIALEQLDLRGYDLIISSEAGPAKGVIARPDAVHICYCQTPARSIWTQPDPRGGRSRWVARGALAVFSHYMRLWDATAAMRVDQFVANSRGVARRIRRCYARDALVLHPPVDTALFSPGDERDDFYLLAGDLAPHLRPDLAVDACRDLGRPLVVAGRGKELKELRRRAGPETQVLEAPSFDVLKLLYRRCRALLCPGEEDFGIAPVEAMASGAPVLAFKAGGALETIVDGRNGLFFTRQDGAALRDAILRFEASGVAWGPERIARHAQGFGTRAFADRFGAIVDDVLSRAGRDDGAGGAPHRDTERAGEARHSTVA